MTSALPGEFKARGYVDRKTGQVGVRFEAGEGVAALATARLRAYLDQPRYTILNSLGLGGQDKEPWSAFLAELSARQYDLSTFKFSVFLASAGRRIPRVRLIQQRPGVLHSRWARVEWDSPDVCSAWARPCRRADSSLWMALLSSPTFRREELPTRAEFLKGPSLGYGLLGALKDEGFDIRTLRMEVRSSLPPHPDDLPE